MLALVVTLVALLGHTSQGAVGGTVSGVVLDEGSRAPVVGARVTLAPPIAERRGRPTLSILSVDTDASGRFVFSGVPPGRYVLSVTASGYGTRSEGSDIPPLTVTASERFENLELSLRRAGAITGRVVDPDGRPVGTSVTAIRKLKDGLVTPGSGRPVPTAGRAVTDADGVFRVEGLVAGEYYLQARGGQYSGPSMNGLSATLEASYYPGTTNAQAATSVMAVDGDVTAVGELRMVAATAFDVSGTVVDDAGAPVPGAMLRLVPATSPPTALPSSRESARSDSVGGFVLRMVAGRYLLVAVPPLVLSRGPVAAGQAAGESVSFFAGGTRPETRLGAVRTESKDGLTVQFRDELATRVPVTIDGNPIAGIVVVVKRP